MEGILCFKIDWASLIVGSKFAVFALFHFAFEGNFKEQAPRVLYLERVFCITSLGAYIWTGLYMEGLIFGISILANFV